MPLSQLADRRRAATRMFQEALARAEAQRGRVDERFALQGGRLERDFDQGREQLLRSLGGVGLGRSPRTAGRQIRTMRDQLGEDAGVLAFERAEMLAALESMIGEAEGERDLEFSSIEAERARIEAAQREAQLQQQAAQAAAEAQLAAIREMADRQKAEAAEAQQSPKAAPSPPPAPKGGGGGSPAPKSTPPQPTLPAPRQRQNDHLATRRALFSPVRPQQRPRQASPGSFF